MAYQLINTNDGQFAIDPDVIGNILRSFIRAGCQLDYARVVTESQVGLNPFSWGLPDLQYVDVDWDMVARKTASGLFSAWIDMNQLLYRSPRSAADQLRFMQAETRRWQDRFHGLMQQASQASQQAIDRSVSNYQTAIDVSRGVRDLSGVVLTAISTAGVGTAVGVGAGVLATGIKSYAKYQDSGSIGSASVEAMQDLVFIILPGEQLTGKALKVIICAVADTGKGLLEGKPVSEAVMKGSLQLAMPAVTSLVKSDAVQTVLKRAAVPVVTTLVTGDAAVIAKLPGAAVEKVGQMLAGKGGQAVIGWMTGSGQSGAAAGNGANLADRLTFKDEQNALVKLAIIDMARGVAI